MPNEHLDAQARRVVVGYDKNGKATIVEDGLTTTRLAGKGNTKCDIWRVDRIPIPLDSSDGLTGKVITPPPPEGLVYRLTTFPPDAEWDRAQGYADANGPLPGSVPPEEVGGILGMHRTTTFDILCVLSGELHLVLETGETLFRPGDTLVLSGQPHAWSNRTDKPATVVALLISGEPS
jgi:mannose-6-phosphate isomerase-like protein (cupin superfamily)